MKPHTATGRLKSQLRPQWCLCLALPPPECLRCPLLTSTASIGLCYRSGVCSHLLALQLIYLPSYHLPQLFSPIHSPTHLYCLLTSPSLCTTAYCLLHQGPYPRLTGSIPTLTSPQFNPRLNVCNSQYPPLKIWFNINLHTRLLVA